MLIHPASALPALFLLLDGAHGALQQYSKADKVGGEQGRKARADAAAGTAPPTIAPNDDGGGDDGPGGLSAEAGGCGERVVIVGGGFAGLAAARDLLLAGHTDVTVGVAQSEVGGRAATMTVVDPTTNATWPGITTGAHWLLGSEPGENLGVRQRGAIYEYAALAGVLPDLQDAYYAEDWSNLVPAGQGRFPPDEQMYLGLDHGLPCEDWMYTPRDAVYEEFMHQCMRNWVKIPDAKHRADRNWDKAFELDAEREQPFSAVAQACLITSISENDYGAPSTRHRGGEPTMDDMWAGNMWEGVSYTADHTLREGFTPIYTWLEEDIKSRGGIILKNTRVLEVTKGVSDGDSPEGFVMVKTRPAGGGALETLRADRVVSTVSVGVLKRAVKNKLLKFSPALPQSHQTAIKNIGMGHLEKLWLIFPSAFWLRTQLYDDEGWRGLYTLGHHPASLEGGPIKFQSILFDRENSSCQVWFGGDDAVRYMKGVVAGTPEFEALKTNVTDQFMVAVRDIFANDARFLDTDGSPIAVEEPRRDLTFMSNWMGNKNFLGYIAYLTRRAGSQVTQYREGLDALAGAHANFDGRRALLFEGYSGDRLALGAPAREGPWAGRLFFAGEATSLGLGGLVHGAIETGQRAAIEVGEQSTCSAGSVRKAKKVAVPYFASKVTDRSENAIYKSYAKIKQGERWETKWKEGYRWLGFGDKKAYMSVGCTDMENGLTFEEAESETNKFRKGLKKLNYIQDDDDDYSYGVGWVGDYNCYINHYNSWSWADFEEEWESTWHLETLGVTADEWDSNNMTDPGKPYSRDWKDLTRPQKRAAAEMCYTEHVWNTWGVGCSSSSSSD